MSEPYPDNEVHGAHLGPTGPRWACWPHELCYQGSFLLIRNLIGCGPLSPVAVISGRWNRNHTNPGCFDYAICLGLKAESVAIERVPIGYLQQLLNGLMLTKLVIRRMGHFNSGLCYSFMTDICKHIICLVTHVMGSTAWEIRNYEQQTPVRGALVGLDHTRQVAWGSGSIKHTYR